MIRLFQAFSGMDRMILSIVVQNFWYLPIIIIKILSADESP